MKRSIEPGYRSGWRTLPIDILTCEHRGPIELALADGRRIICQRGEGLCIPAYVTHETLSLRTTPGVSTWTTGLFRIWGTVALLSLFETPCILPCSAARRVGLLSEELRITAKRPRGLGQALAIRSIGIALAAVIADSVPASPAFGALVSGAGRMRPILEYIGEHLTTVTIEELANRFCLSPRRLHALFDATMSTSPGRYLQSLRIHQARRLLVTTSLSVQEIGERSGYADAFHFSRQFKTCCGMSPRAYRTSGETRL